MSVRRGARRRGDAGEDEAGEGYFASVSDLMVGVLFVFLLMLTVFALNFRDAEQAQTVERLKYEQALRELEQERARAAAQEAIAQAAQAEAARQHADNEHLRSLLQRAMAQIAQDIQDREAARLRLLTSLKSELHDRHIEVSLDPGSGVLRLSGDLLFDTGSAQIGQRAGPVIQTLANVLAGLLPCYTGNGAIEACSQVCAIV